jgi:hypothetical protein
LRASPGERSSQLDGWPGSSGQSQKSAHRVSLGLIFQGLLGFFNKNITELNLLKSIEQLLFMKVLAKTAG